jgi:hypothetical protein
LPTMASLGRTVACIVCSSLFVQAEISNELPAALGQREQLKRSARPRRLQRSTGRPRSIAELVRSATFTGVRPPTPRRGRFRARPGRG